MAEHIQTLMRRLFFGGGRRLCVQNATSVTPERPQGLQTLTSVAPGRCRGVRREGETTSLTTWCRRNHIPGDMV